MESHGGWFTEMANVGHFEGKAAGKSYYSLYSWYRGISIEPTHPPRWSVLTRERNPPSGSTNQIAASVAHAIASMNPPPPPPNHSTVGYGVLYHWILFEPPTVHLKFPIFSTIKPERFFAKLKFSRNEHIVFASFHNFLMYNISSKIAVLYAAPNVRVDEK